MTIKQCDHEWIVFSTALVPPTIMVQCAECGAYGGVLEHTIEEWRLAFYAPTMPFRWADDGRVILYEDLPTPSPEELARYEDWVEERRHALRGDKLVGQAQDDMMTVKLWKINKMADLIDDLDLGLGGDDDAM